jgi:CubicO group peptidase (beta-lactamase class C family)
MTLDLRYPAQPASTPWPAVAWPRGPLPSTTDRAKLEGLLDLAFSVESHPAMGETHAFLAVQGGRVVAERYAGGQHTAASTYPSWSMAKSITQLLIGFLAAEEAIDIDAPLNAPEWQAEDDPRALLTWTQLLHMSSGLEFVEDYIDGTRSDVIEMLFASGKDDVAAYAASKPLAHAPDTVFNYASGTSNILARAMGLKVGRRRDNVKAFMQARLFGPLGITSAIPKFDEKGTFIGSSYCFMTAEDFARIGLLALRGGMWDGNRLLPQSWIDFARTPGPVQPAEQDRGYGAHWWLDMFSPGGFSMNGYAGQWVACCPERDLVVVRHGDSVNEAAAQRQQAALEWLRQAMACFGG